jgi:hypothetical protein
MRLRPFAIRLYRIAPRSKVKAQPDRGKAMKYLIFCLTAGALAMAGAAPAQAPSSGQAKAAKPKKEKKVCHEVMKSGSHLPTVTCKTAAQWAEQEATAAEDAESARNRLRRAD